MNPSPLMEQKYIFRWNRMERKGQACIMEVRGASMNSCLVRFDDGFAMVTSRNALKKAPVDKSNSGDK